MRRSAGGGTAGSAGRGAAAAVIAVVLIVLVFTGLVVFVRSRRSPAPAPPAAGSGKMLVRFVDAGGDPVRSAGYEVTHDWNGGSSGGGGTAPDGWCIANAPPDGTLLVEVCGRRTLFGRTLETEHVRVAVPSPRPAELVVRVGPPLHIQGRIVGEAGEAVEGATVTALVPGATSSFTTGLRTARTDPDGDFDIPSCGALDYDLRVAPPPEWVRPAPVRARGGAEDVSVVLRRGVKARITVLDAAGSPVADAQVAAVRTDSARGAGAGGGATYDSTPTRRTTGKDGVALVGGIDPALAFTLVVTPPHERTDLFPERVTDWDRGDRVVRLELALSASGIVVTQTGIPIPGAQVLLREEPRSWRGTTTDASGRFRLTGLRRGVPAEVVASCGSVGSDSMRSVETGERAAERVEPGATDVRLTLDVRGFVFLVASNGDDTDARHPYEAPPVRWSSDASGGHVAGLSLRKPILIPGLDPDRTVTILVGPSRLGRCALLRDVVPDGRTIDVVLERCQPLSGRVDGVARSEAHGGDSPFVIELSLGETVLVTQLVAPDGTFRIAGLPDAEWMIRARRTRSSDRPGVAVTARPGATEVVVPAPEGAGPDGR